VASSFGNASVNGSAQECPASQPDYWLEIRLQDPDGNLVPHEEYVVTLSDGSTVRGYLDDQGWARFAPLADGGDCQVSFPNIDSEAWQFDHSEGPKGQS
jgi:hypothetical protein